MKTLAALVLITSWLLAPALRGQQATPPALAPVVSLAGTTVHTSTPTPAQIAACLASLPQEPKAPKARGKSMFSGFQNRVDGVLKQGGIDPDAMRAQADQAAKDKYQADEDAYQKKKSACSAPVITPAAAEQASPSVAPVTPPADAKPMAPAPTSSKPVMSADGRHLYVCPKGSVNAPDGLPVCKTPDGGYVPLQEIPIPAGTLSPPASKTK